MEVTPQPGRAATNAHYNPAIGRAGEGRPAGPERTPAALLPLPFPAALRPFTGEPSPLLTLTRWRYNFTLYEDMRGNLLTDFELMILLAVLRVGEEAYGVQIAREIESTCGRRVLLGAAYAALDRLERNGLVSSTTGEPTPERGGRAKRFFRVTPRGVRAARNTQQALVALWRDVPQLKESQP